MSELLLLGGAALCALSLVVAVVQLIQTVPPRAGAILFVLGVAAMVAGAAMDPRPFGPRLFGDAWQDLRRGDIAG